MRKLFGFFRRICGRILAGAIQNALILVGFQAGKSSTFLVATFEG